MKVILGIFCGIVALFAGGCAIILAAGSGYSGVFQSVPLAAIPGGIAALNVLVLIALFGRAKPQRWAFHVLIALDAIAALIVAIVWASTGTRDSDMNALAGSMLFLILLKGLLTFIVAQRLPREPQEGGKT